MLPSLNLASAPIKENIANVKKANSGQFRGVFKNMDSFFLARFASQLIMINTIRISSVPTSNGTPENLAIAICWVNGMTKIKANRPISTLITVRIEKISPTIITITILTGKADTA